jgi:hypothetical protein
MVSLAEHIDEVLADIADADDRNQPFRLIIKIDRVREQRVVFVRMTESSPVRRLSLR